MVESKFVVFQMIPHTLFIEWDFGHCSLVVLLFMKLFTSRFTVHQPLVLFMTLFTSRCEVLFTYTILFIYTIRLHIRYYSYDQFFSLNVHF